MLLSRVPYPLEKGDKLRAFHHLKSLHQKHKVILVCLNDSTLPKETEEVLRKHCYQLHIIQLSKPTILFNLIKAVFSSTPFQVSYFYQSDAQKKINDIIEKEMPRHIYFQLIRTAEYVKPYKLISSTLDYMDAFSKGMERRLKDSNFLFSYIYKKEAKRLRRYESEVFRYFKNKTIISEQDRECIDHPEKHDIGILPNGVDFDFFHPKTIDKEFDIVFTGNMNYPPNIQSAEYLAKEIMPLLWQQKPDARLLISGATPNIRVKRLANDKVIVTGWVDDIRESYWKSKVFVAPMQLGSGLQNKLLEAMSMGIPCITSQLANNALKATDQKEVLIGHTPEEYVNHILDLMNNQEKYNAISTAALHYVHQHFSWESNTDFLLDLIEKN